MITEIPRKGTSVAGLLQYLGGPHRTDARLLETNLAGDSHQDWTQQIESLARNHWPRSEAAAREIERRWQLRAVQPSKEVRDKAPTHGEWR